MKTVTRQIAFLALFCGALTVPVAAGTDAWCSHVTFAGGWKTSLSLFNSGNQSAAIDLYKYDNWGQQVGAVYLASIPKHAWFTVPSAALNVEGTARVVSSDNLLVKASYQFGDSPSVCEFYLQSDQGTSWLLPNAVRPWFDYTGLAMVNPTDGTMVLEHAKAWKNGQVIANNSIYAIGSHYRYVTMADQIFQGLGYDDADTFTLETGETPIPAPISITGNFAGDRHLFFSGRPLVAAAAAKPEGFGGECSPEAYSTYVWCPHITAAGGWKTSLQVYNPGTSTATFTYDRYDEFGNEQGSSSSTVSARSWKEISSVNLGYEGSLLLKSASTLIVKASYQFGETASVCEFFLDNERKDEWVLPNSVRPWFSYTGLALVNPLFAAVHVQVTGLKNGATVATSESFTIPPFSKFVRLTDGIFSGVAYADIDTLVVNSDQLIPPPINITGNTAGDRHLFFTARPWLVNDSGDPLFNVFVGDLRYVRKGSFTQGAAPFEGCQGSDEIAFEHHLTRSFAAMSREVTRSMWAYLKSAEPTLPADPSYDFPGSDNSHPVQKVTWNEAVLFANLLSKASGLRPCYYKDFLFLIPVSAANYNTGAILCDFNAPGFRLPTEGEWEYLCRAGTTGAFSCGATGYSLLNCADPVTPGKYANLEDHAWFAANAGATTHPSGSRYANDWLIADTHGNVAEWCWDVYAPYPEGSQFGYSGPANGEDRVVRGGSFLDEAKRVRSANREAKDPQTDLATIGFRLVCTIP